MVGEQQKGKEKIMSKMCIAVVDCVDSNAFRVSAPSVYIPKAKKTEDEKRNEVREVMMKGYGWPPSDDEEIDLCDFDRIVKRIGKKDEFRVGYLTIPDDIGKPFFNNPETQKMFTKSRPRVINREEYQKIIGVVRTMIVDRYYQILQDKHSWQGVLETKLDMWESLRETPYNLEYGTTATTNIYEPEIQIWDLVRMYKTVDWMRDNVVLYDC